jgi:hypothetical protein
MRLGLSNKTKLIQYLPQDLVPFKLDLTWRFGLLCVLMPVPYILVNCD